MNITILVITFEGGNMTYIPKNEEALEFIVCHFDHIEEIYEVDLDAWFKVEDKKGGSGD